MTLKFYAHSGNNEDKSDWQMLSNHLRSVGSIAKNNARFFRAETLSELAGLMHDLGKYTMGFQKRLEGGPRVDHATAGAQVALQKWGNLGKLVAYVVAGHHAGLANGVDEGKGRSTLAQRLKMDISKLNEIWEKEIELPESIEPPKLIPSKNQEGFQAAFLIRMIFSCLVDADYIDTELFYSNLEGKEVARGYKYSLEILQESLNRYFGELRAKLLVSTSEVNSQRDNILHTVREKSNLSPGLFSLSVPTGGGKTLASMAFSLDHAIKHNLRRIIYVIPFTSIVEQNAGVFRDVFKDIGQDVVLEHHSSFDDEKIAFRDETKDKLKLAMENWDAPIVVTTAVQFFESLFADRTSKCRKLHNITGSVIILDEAQMLPLNLLRPTMAAIDELARNYNCSIVLCTATQPALKQSDHFYKGFKSVRELAPDPVLLSKRFERVSVRHLGVMDDNQIIDEVKERRQALVIVNNRRHARVLCDLLGDGEGHHHLTTLMCAKHRAEIMRAVREDLKQNRVCRVISTSLIEAGVDVDFPTVMRAEAGLDSIAQAAGRCNREGLRPKELSEVLIFQSPEWKAPPELDQFAASMRHISRRFEDELLSLEAIKAYFQDVYWRKGEELDAKKILKRHKDHYQNLSFPFQNIARDYRIIENHMVPVVVSYDGEAEKWVKRLRYAERLGEIPRRLQPYLVQIPRSAVNSLVSVGSIETIGEERFGDQFKLLINNDLYDQRAGLKWDDPAYLKVESTVI